MTSENAAVAAATDKALGVLRNYFCPKCGAVGDVRWVQPVTQDEWDVWGAEHEAYREKYLAAGGQPLLFYVRPFRPPEPSQGWDLASEGLEHGEHLACTCPRCGHSWRDLVIAATADSPIYDELAAS